MGEIDSDSLDRYITGNYGEDQYINENCRNCETKQEEPTPKN